jgi:hypothetical protein
MTKLTPLALLLALLLCGFGPGKEGEEPEPKPETEEEEEAGGAMDMSQSTIDMYVNGTIKASYWVVVHKDPKAGQYWETFYEAYGTKTTNRWQVASVDGDTAVVENQMKMNSAYAKSNYVLAYEVNLKAEQPKDGGKIEANVTKAWIGLPGKEGKEIKVMEVPEPVAGGAPAAKVEMNEEEFKDLELGGGKWSGKKMTMKGDGWEYTAWTADKGWFGGVIKTETSGMTIALKAFGEDSKALLELPEEKEADKTDEKKDEKEEKDGN